MHIQCVYTGQPVSSDDDDDNTPAIIGGTIGGILFLISFSVTIAVLWWRSKHRQNVDVGKNYDIQFVCTYS